MSYFKMIKNTLDQLNNMVDDNHYLYAEKEMELHRIIFELDEMKKDVVTSNIDVTQRIEGIQERIKNVVLGIHRENS